jgi:ApaG protein
MKTRYAIDVHVQPRYLADQSDPEKQRFVFAYHVIITNTGAVRAQLKSRHWIIEDSDGKVEEVRGPGVVGEQPVLDPGERFEYTSGAMLKTAVGTMRGSYQMEAEDGQFFDADIARFTLSIPRTLH